MIKINITYKKVTLPQFLKIINVKNKYNRRTYVQMGKPISSKREMLL